MCLKEIVIKLFFNKEIIIIILYIFIFINILKMQQSKIIITWCLFYLNERMPHKYH
jgi:hypothetical protein